MTCSGVQKVTTMVLKVDLDCCQCYRKVKKTLCQFPQIRNQVYDEKNNTVIITVICCSPERIRDKLCSKAGKAIKCIDIVVPIKPKPPTPAPVPPCKPEPTPAPDPPCKPEPTPAPDPPCKPEPTPTPVPPCKPVAQWVPCYPPGPPLQVFPVGVVCCNPCYRPGCPCGYYYGRPQCPPCYCRSPCYYFCEENPSACSIM